MAIDDFDLDEEDGMRELAFPKEAPPDFQKIAGHPLMPLGISPALWGQMWALIQLQSEGYFAEHDDRFMSNKDHEDYVLYILPSIRQCRQVICDGFRGMGITEDLELITEESMNALQELQNELSLLSTIAEGARPSVSYSKAYELPLDPKPQEQCVVLLEEILVLRRHLQWLMDAAVLAADPQGPIWKKNREFTAQKYDVKQLEPAIALDRRRIFMTTLLQTYFPISERSASLTVDDLINEAYPERFPHDQPSRKRDRSLWRFLKQEQWQEYKKKKEWDKYMDSIRR